MALIIKKTAGPAFVLALEPVRGTSVATTLGTGEQQVFYGTLKFMQVHCYSSYHSIGKLHDLCVVLNVGTYFYITIR